MWLKIVLKSMIPTAPVTAMVMPPNSIFKKDSILKTALRSRIKVFVNRQQLQKYKGNNKLEIVILHYIKLCKIFSYTYCLCTKDEVKESKWYDCVGFVFIVSWSLLILAFAFALGGRIRFVLSL